MRSQNREPGQPMEAEVEQSDLWDSDMSISLASWQDWEKIAARDHSRHLRQQVNAIFREQLMGGLALLLIPILLLLDFVKIPAILYSLLSILDVAIWIFFILEYACRLLVAEDRRAYVTSPWNLFYLFILVVPAIALVFGGGYGIARYFRILRGMQAVTVLFLTGRAASHHAVQPVRPDESLEKSTLQVHSLPLAPPPASVPDWSAVTLSDPAAQLPRQGLLLDFSRWGPRDLPAMASLSGIPLYILEEKLRERSYPRADKIGNKMTVFLKVPVITRDPTERWTLQFSWNGFLTVYEKESIITFTRSRLTVVEALPESGSAEGIPLTGPGIVYLVLRDTLDAVEDLILKAEEQLIYLEALPLEKLPANYLNMMYTDQKELSRILSWLLHTKNAIMTAGGSGSDISGEEHSRLSALIDRCASLSDTAQNVSDSFGRMVDFYLNSTSFQINQVMKILGVLTALTLVPTLIGGLLGMNLIDNPWPATLLQMITAVVLLMLITAWVYFNLGWLKH